MTPSLETTKETSPQNHHVPIGKLNFKNKNKRRFYVCLPLLGGKRGVRDERLILTSLLILNDYWTFPRKPGSVLGAGVKSGRNAQFLSWWNYSLEMKSE